MSSLHLPSALVGHTGFVGSNLKSQYPFDEFYRSTDIDQIRGKSFGLVVCAGIQAKKWWANDHPAEDLNSIEKLLANLRTISVKRFVLISTVDVYPRPWNVDERTPVDAAINHAYGKNRYLAEEAVREHFPEHLIVRLPGLFGNGIKKNVIHDLLNDHELEKINPAAVYQYYSLDRLADDLERAASLGIRLLNIASEPVSTREIIVRFFPGKDVGPDSAFKASYDMKSVYSRDWGSSQEGYLYNQEAVLDQLGRFVERQHS